jgi:signal transduction histidine kinase
MVEPINIATLMDDAVRLNSTSFERHKIRVEREYMDLPTLLVDKQRILQIMINLIKNAKDALVEQHDKDRILTLSTSADRERLIIQIADTGIGIKKEHLTKIFSHGFTTKPSGHGFGLHSCANAATEMEGSLSVVSDGYMQGATFTLSLPYLPATISTT